MSTSGQPRGVARLPAEMGSLARGVPADAPAGMLFVLTYNGGIQVHPESNYIVTFGRNMQTVDVCLGENDAGVSREHGQISREGRQWWLHNTGRLPIRFPQSTLLLAGHRAPLAQAYTPLFIRTDAGREHLLEVRIADWSGRGAHDQPDQDTRVPQLWTLKEAEKLALVALGQRYLRHEPHPQPLPWAEVAEMLSVLQPNARWTKKAVEHRVRDVRLRMAKANVPGLTEEEIPRPIGNTLNHNLLMELLNTTTLVPPDLTLLGDGESWEYRDSP